MTADALFKPTARLSGLLEIHLIPAILGFCIIDAGNAIIRDFSLSGNFKKAY